MVNRIVFPVMMVVVPLPVSTDVLFPTIPCLHVADCVGVEPLDTEPKVTLLPSKWKVYNIEVELLLFFLEMKNNEGFRELKALSFWVNWKFSLWI